MEEAKEWSGKGELAIPEAKPISFIRLIFACTVAAGVQYGWALQLSLLTPYVQTLGLSHALSSIMWLCGPVAGFVVQPLVGYWSDRCCSSLGRRRPFILCGCLLICAAVMIIAFSSDIGYALGDTTESCNTYVGPRWKAALVYVFGFWMLDFSNNAVQGPARAMMADISEKHGTNAANAIFCAWMAFGNILGYTAGSNGSFHKWFPFLLTEACCEACANLKAAFLIAVIFLLFCLTVTLVCAAEVKITTPPKDGTKSPILEIFKSFKSLPPGMSSVLIVTAVTWLSWFPFILYDTDWMGREVFHGDPKGTPAEIDAYDRGVREGSLGLLLNSIVLAISSFLIEPLCRTLTSRVVWAIGNFCVFLAMVAITVLSMASLNGGISGEHIKTAALIIFAAMGFPLSLLYSVPWAVASQLAAQEGGGQGLCIGLLNIAIVVPQVIIALGAGPWDAIFGKGNVPAFALAAVFAFICCFMSIVMLPRLSGKGYSSAGISGGH